MKEEEIEKQAEKYRKENYVLHSDPLKALCEQSWIDGAKWGMEHATEWHDLRKNPNDLPKEDCTEVMFITKGKMETLTGKYKNGGGEGTPIFDTFGIAFYGVDQVIAWCDLPKFKE